MYSSILIISTVLFAWLLIAPSCMTFRISDENARNQFLNKGLYLKTEYIRVNGSQVHYTMTGNDSLPTLVFIHGSPSAWNSFIGFMKDPELLFHFRMVSVDRPGFGYSNFGEAKRLAEQSKLLLPVLLEIDNGKPVYLVGHSLGGPLAMKMAADNPTGVSGIMLLAGSVDPALEPAETWRKVVEHFPLRYMLPGAFRPSNTELLYFKEDVISLANDFDKVTCSVYLVHGDQDSWVPVGNVEYARKKLINARTVHTAILKGGNHFIPWTRKKEIKEALLNMLHADQLTSRP